MDAYVGIPFNEQQIIIAGLNEASASFCLFVFTAWPGQNAPSAPLPFKMAVGLITGLSHP